MNQDPRGRSSTQSVLSITPASRIRLGVALLAVAAALVAGGAVADVGSADAGDAALPAAGALQQDEATNGTTLHRHPDEVSGEGDDAAVAAWLETHLRESLSDSTAHLDDGEYDQARELLGDDYDRRLAQYAEVDDAETSGLNASEFDRTRGRQREFVDAVERYDEVHGEYEDAREAGDDERARELARELERIADEVRRQGDRLGDRYDNASAESDWEFEEETDTVEQVAENVSETQASIRAAEFDRARLVAEVDDPEASFLDPLTVRGRLRGESGEPLDDRRVRIRTDGRTVATTTDDDGAFRLDYRPALLSADAENVSVTFVPEEGSTYLNTTTEVPIDPERVAANATIDDATERAAFGENVTVEGRVRADDVPVDGVPVVASLGDSRASEPVRTDADGEFTVETRVPADVPAGERSLRVSVPRSDRALDVAPATEAVTIGETDTSLTVDATNGSSATVEASGAFETADGEGLGGRPIRLSVDGTTVETVRTDADGRFEATVDASDATAADDGSVELVATYDSEGTNLGDARDETRVKVAEGDGGFWGGLPAGRTALVAILLVGGLAILGSSASLRSSGFASGGGVLGALPFGDGDEGGETGDAESGRSEERDAADTDERSREIDEATRPSLETAAQRRLDGGATDEAVVVAYERARRHLEREAGIDDALTCREFRDAWRRRRDGDDPRVEALERLTDRYERAAFGPAAIPETDAVDAVAAASDLAE